MGDYKPKDGDRVRVVLEGEARTATSGFSVGHGGYGNFVTPDAEHVVSIEKVEPPAFGPGDTVRSKATGVLRSIGHSGWFNHSTRAWTQCSTTTGFTSRDYELVELR